MKISIRLNIQVYFCIFFTFLHTEGTRNMKSNVDIITNFLHQPGWRNINDVEYITYRRNVYTLNDVITKPVTSLNCDNCIRIATLFLGCSYANDLNTIFYTFFKFKEHCLTLLNDGYDSAHDCTLKLLEKMIDIVPIAKLMKGALYTIEKYHNNPLCHRKKIRFLLSEILTNLQKNESLKKLVPLNNSTDSIKAALLTIAHNLRTRYIDIEEDMKFCQINNSLWNFWNIEFDILKSQVKYEEFFIFLTDTINNLFLMTIWNKYVELGFKFDSTTNETLLPALPPTNVKQDIEQNPSINLTQHTNEVDITENIQQEYITQNPSINLTQHNNDVLEEMLQETNFTQYSNAVDKLGGIRQEDIAKNPSLNLIQHNNEVVMQETIQQHDFTQNVFINMIQNTTEVDKQEGIRQEDVICETEPESGELIEYPDHLIPFNKYI
ncbi:uncharacterized protein LOC126905530 [Daktulosphaira vitifoliae]|uniref:uncharacterized protein LOC126905530 n=1 Tax=Daktulosphaira vitifoliae TaxID=58002 RepID=UPI0021AA2A9B|nr:uncharacterized protein LOC126905530 [Daktulosphaira vitifoliae]